MLKQIRTASPAVKTAASLLLLLLMDALFFRLISNFYLVILPDKFVFRDFVLNLLPVIGLSVLLWLLTARVFASFILTAALFDAIFFANQLKLANLGQPLMAVDFISALNVGGHAGLVSNYFSSVWHPGSLIALVLLSILLLFIEKPTFRVKPHWRVLAVIVLLVGIRTQVASDVLNGIYEPGDDWQAWDPRKNLNHYGLLYSLVHDAGVFASGNREYDLNRIETILRQSPNRHYGSGEELPEVENIVVLLSESFFDPADMNGVRAGQYDLPEYKELQQKSLGGKMTVPAYGGVTLRTEFELLTGIGLDLFPVHRYPLISLVAEPINSIAWDLQREGYSTTGVHPNVGSFWNRDSAYPYLGFERFLDFEVFKRAVRTGYYVSDDALTRKLKKEIKDGDKQFFFAISMENHGPWKTGRPNLDSDIVDSIEVPGALEGESAIAFQQYIYHQQLAETALLDLINDLDERDSRSIVLFFGDHLPGLERTFDALEFKDGGSRYEQTTPYLIYDTHRDLSSLKNPTPVIDVSLLGSILMDLSIRDLAVFHSQAERLSLSGPSPGFVDPKYALTDLQQLQLWRFWEAPVNREGEAYSAVALGQKEKKKVAAMKPLFCPVETWGPTRAYLGERFNEQPDGRSAFYVKSQCDAEDLEIRIDGEALWTSKYPGIMTAALDADELVNETGRHIMELREISTGRSQELGVFKVKKRWFSKPQR